ncbi:MAG: MerR family transcriptional regulator [Desulfobacterales bacterium]|jgi:methylmalonyl-CoA mutase cobalamin-binding subunit/DNA-binding transcriptional MerR regulator
MENNQKIHPIGFVALQTGLSTHVIRVWEKRYRAVQPGRTATGRRLYSENDLQRLLLLQRASRCGHRIGQLSELDDEALQGIVNSKAAAAQLNGDDKQESATAEDLLNACRTAVLDLDGPALEAALNRAAVFLTRPVLFEGVVIPLVEEIGNRWASGTLKIINEHLATSILRSFLWDMLSAYRPPSAAPNIVIATPAAQWHELGALIAAVIAAEAGWAVHYFGPNLPAEEIAAAAAIKRAAAVAISIIYRAGEAQMLREIKKLRQYLTEDAVLIVGGSGVRPHQANLKQIGALRVKDFTDFRAILAKLA